MGQHGNCVFPLSSGSPVSVSNAVMVQLICRPFALLLRWQQCWHFSNIGEGTPKRVTMKELAYLWLLNGLSPSIKASFQILVNSVPLGQCWCFYVMQCLVGTRISRNWWRCVRTRGSHERWPLHECAQILEQSLREAAKSPFLEIFKAWLDKAVSNLM